MYASNGSISRSGKAQAEFRISKVGSSYLCCMYQFRPPRTSNFVLRRLCSMVVWVFGSCFEFRGNVEGNIMTVRNSQYSIVR